VTFILGVDLDGVCGDHTAAFRAVVAAELDVDPASLGPQERWDFADWGLSEESFLEIHRRAVVEHRMFRSMPVVPDCAEVLWRLSDAGVWIRLITHRLYASWGHGAAAGDTVAWLDDAGIPYRDLCFLGRKPQVEADCYLDDAPHNIRELREAGNHVIVFDQPYNRAVDGSRASCWLEVEELVVARMTEVGQSVQATLPGVDEPAIGRLRNATQVPPSARRSSP